MHTCDGRVYCRKDGSRMRECGGLSAKPDRRPSGIMRLAAWVRSLFRGEEELYDNETP